MKVAILTIGDEISIGQIVNTNAAWIAGEITALGADVVTHMVCRDNEPEIVSSIEYLEKSSDIIIITGGLGSTHDDITKVVLAKYFKSEMVFNSEVFEHITTLCSKMNVEVSERNKAQAMLPHNCKALINPLGTAAGMLFFENGKCYASLPGVPYEMKAIMNDSLLRFIDLVIKEKHEKVTKYKTLIAGGIPESSLADLLGDAKTFLLEGDSLAFLPSPQGIRLRIGSASEDSEKAQIAILRIENYILSKAKKYIFSTQSQSLSETVGNLLKEKNFMLAIAESCTGGMLGSTIVDPPGSSEYFLGGTIVYSNQAKLFRLGVSPETLLNYGAVSEETAYELAFLTRNLFKSDLALSITGIAGPGSDGSDKPVGTVWVGLATPNGVFCKLFNFNGTRDIVRERAVTSSLLFLYNHINENY